MAVLFAGFCTTGYLKKRFLQGMGNGPCLYINLNPPNSHLAPPHHHHPIIQLYMALLIYIHIYIQCLTKNWKSVMDGDCYCWLPDKRFLQEIGNDPCLYINLNPPNSHPAPPHRHHLPPGELQHCTQCRPCQSWKHQTHR